MAPQRMHDTTTPSPSSWPLDAVDRLLTTTRSVRKMLDLEAPVDQDTVLDCLRIALHAPNGSNQQSWRWIVVADPATRAQLAEVYRESYLASTGGRWLAENLRLEKPSHRVLSSAEWLVEHLHQVPLLIIPCYESNMPRQAGDESFYAATAYGSVFPAVWNFQLALHSRGYGTCLTTLHLLRQAQVSAILGIPEHSMQMCLLPVAQLRNTTPFGPAPRGPAREVIAFDRWDGRQT